MDRNYLQWNFVNWITVLIMAGAGFFLFGLVRSAIVGKQQEG
jgi:hypothetical protein